jgi:hypothetical protein
MIELDVPRVLRGTSFAGEPAHLRVADLIVDPRYQRELNIRRVRRDSEQFDPMVFGMLLISQRSDMTKVILDGQHRKAMLILMGWEDQLVPCFVYRGLSLEDEAKIFRMTNERRVRPTSIDLFRARVVEKDPVATDITSILSGHGLRVTTGGEKNSFAAVAAAQRVYTDSGRDVFRNAIAIMASHPNRGNDRNTVSGDLLVGLGMVLVEYGQEMHLDRLQRQFCSESPTALIGRARAAKAAIGGEMSLNLATQLVNLYNKGLRNGRLEDLSRRPWRRNLLKAER